MKRALAFFLLLLVLPTVRAIPTEVVYPPSKAFPQDALYLNGKLYVTAMWNESPLLLVFYPNGTLERVVRYTVGEGSIFPNTVEEFNGTLMIAGSLMMNSSRRFFLMAVSGNGSVLWAKGYDINGAVSDVVPGNGSLLLLGDDGKDMVMLEVSTNGSVIRGFKYDSKIMSLWQPKGVRDGGGLLICGVALEYTRPGEMAILLRVDGNGRVEWAKTYRRFQESFCNDIEAPGGEPMAVIQSGARVVLVGVDGENGPSIVRAVEIPGGDVSRFGEVMAIGEGRLLISTAPPGYLILSPDNRTRFVSLGGIAEGRFTKAALGGGLLYFAGTSGEGWKLSLFVSPLNLSPGYPVKVVDAVPLFPEGRFYDERIEAYVLNTEALGLNVTAEVIHWKPEILERWYRVAVDSSPRNATVWIDGTPDGGTPTILYLSQGEHTIRMRKRGYLPANMTLNVSGDTGIFLELTPLNGTLRVSSNLDGSVLWIDGKPVGEITGIMTQEVAPGTHEVRVTKTNHTTFELTVDVEPNETVEINAELRPLPARLTIIAPENSSVYINGTYRGKAPMNLSLSPGLYIVNVTEGELWNATSVTLGPNETVSLEFSLPRRKPHGWGLPLLLTFLAILGVGAYMYTGKKRGMEVSETRTEEFTEIRAGRAFGISHVGNRDNNEDNLLVMRLPDAYLLAVADGLGGHNAGEVASQMAVDTLREVFEREYRRGMSDDDVKGLLEKAHKLAHERITENAVGEREGMGTTLVTAFVRKGKTIIINTGDSRAYLIRDGEIVKRTKDHSLVQELLDNGEITEEEAKRHPMRNIITKALGIDFGVTPYEWELKRGDVLLLSSDGLHDYVDEERIVEIASTGRTAEEIARRLVEEALPVTKDNVTVVVWK